jgi:hypothetical protein
VLDYLGISGLPEAALVLEDQEQIDEHFGVGVENRVEPVVSGRPFYVEMSAREHSTSVLRHVPRESIARLG